LMAALFADREWNFAATSTFAGSQSTAHLRRWLWSTSLSLHDAVRHTDRARLVGLLAMLMRGAGAVFVLLALGGLARSDVHVAAVASSSLARTATVISGPTLADTRNSGDPAAFDRAAARLAGLLGDGQALSPSNGGQSRLRQYVGLLAASAEQRGDASLLERGAAILADEARPVPTAIAGELHAEQGALLRRAADIRPDQDLLGQAVAAISLALQEANGNRTALFQNELALTQRMLGEAQHSGEILREAVANYRLALAQFERDGDTVNATVVKMNLMVALIASGQAGIDNTPLVEADRISRELLAETDRAQSPRRWTMLRANQGAVLATLGSRTRDEATLVRSVGALDSALEGAATDDRPRLEWAETENYLAVALQALGEVTGKTDVLQRALIVSRNASVLYHSAYVDQYAFYFETRHAKIEEEIAERQANNETAATALSPPTLATQ
jgi:tetratricopeptide (TPR) repeat protein